MQLRRYKGRQLPDVMRRIREELGPDAVILHTRHPRGWLRFAGGAAVEVLAAVDPPAAGERAPGAATPAPAETSTPTAPGRPPGRGRSGGAERRGPGPRPTAAGRGFAAGQDHRPEEGAGARPGSTVEARLAELRDLVMRLGGVRLLAPELAPFWERLVASGLDESLAHAVLAGLPRLDGDGRPLAGPALAAAVEARLISMIPIAGSVLTDATPAVAVIGPPGAGKTTTLAKLAARARIAGAEAEIVSLADGGLGAPSPLEAFARIVGAAYTFVLGADDLPPVLARAANRATIFIDTPALTPGDAARRAEVGALLRAAAVARVHLVLPATCRPVDALAMLRATEPLGVTDVIWTRLDETAHHGGALGVSIEGGRPLAFFTAGPDVPGDIEPATAAGLVRRVLAAEVPA
jgi:flagellar biosynthesis protein FlhF